MGDRKLFKVCNCDKVPREDVLDDIQNVMLYQNSISQIKRDIDILESKKMNSRSDRCNKKYKEELHILYQSKLRYNLLTRDVLDKYGYANNTDENSNSVDADAE